MDAAYRSDLREMNELNFARFDAKLDQRLAELRAELHTDFARFEAKIERRLGDQTRWYFLAWAAQLAAIMGLWLR